MTSGILNDTRPAMCMALADFFCNHDNQFLYSIFPFHSTLLSPVVAHACIMIMIVHACMDFSIKACDCGEIYIKFSIFFKISNRLVKVIDGQLIELFSILQLYIQIWCFWRFWLFSWLLACTCTWQTAYVVTVII